MNGIVPAAFYSSLCCVPSFKVLWVFHVIYIWLDRPKMSKSSDPANMSKRIYFQLTLVKLYFCWAAFSCLPATLTYHPIALICKWEERGLAAAIFILSTRLVLIKHQTCRGLFFIPQSNQLGNFSQIISHHIPSWFPMYLMPIKILSRSPFCGPDAIECLGSSQEWDS